MKKRMAKIAEDCHRYMESYRKFNKEVYAPLSGAQRKWAMLCNIILSLYIAIIVVLHSSVGSSAWVAPFSTPLLFCTAYQAFKLFLLRHGGIYISINKERDKLSWKTFTVVSAILFTTFILNLFANYPGGVNSDIIDQWNQVQSGKFHNWHPAIHTMMIWLITRILPMYSFFIAFQILVFSMAIGYITVTLKAWGIRRRWIIFFIIAAASNRSTRSIFLYAFKDTALTILLLFLTVFLINILWSNGKWLLKWRNICIIAVVSSLATLVRHNGFFFTLPVGILIMVCYVKITRKAILVFVASVLILLGITRIGYPLAGVTYYESQKYIESVGLPMTILSGAMAKNPEKLDDQTRKFMNKMATDKEWATTFKLGSYNSIKSDFNSSKFLEDIHPKEIIFMTLRTILNDPKSFVYNIIELTRMVWNPLDWHHGLGIMKRSPETMAIFYSEREISAVQPIVNISKILNGIINTVINMLIPTFLLSSIGLHMLILLFFGVYSVNRNLGAKSLIFFIPSVMYNLGTMLLLSGPDYRFFHFNTIITIPLIIALLAKPEKTAT